MTSSIRITIPDIFLPVLDGVTDERLRWIVRELLSVLPEMFDDGELSVTITESEKEPRVLSTKS